MRRGCIGHRDFTYAAVVAGSSSSGHFSSKPNKLAAKAAKRTARTRAGDSGRPERKEATMVVPKIKISCALGVSVAAPISKLLLTTLYSRQSHATASALANATRVKLLATPSC